MVITIPIYSNLWKHYPLHSQAVATDIMIVGFTNDHGQGTLLLMSGSLQILGVLYPKIANKHGHIAGIYGFHDGKFAVAVYVSMGVHAVAKYQNKFSCIDSRPMYSASCTVTNCFYFFAVVK